MNKAARQIVFWTIIIWPVVSHGQVSVSKNTFSFGGGYSLPVGKFASERLDDWAGGLAGSGYFGQVAYERRLVSWLGIRLSASHNRNTTHPDPIVEKSDQLIDMYREVINEWGTYTWEPVVGDWRVSTVLAGPVIYLHFGRLQLTGHGQAGRMFVRSPSVALSGVSSSGNNAVEASMAAIDSQSWGIGGGVSLRIPLGGPVRLQLSADAMACQATFDNFSLRGKIGEYEAVQMMTEKRPVGIVNVGAGLVFDF